MYDVYYLHCVHRVYYLYCVYDVYRLYCVYRVQRVYHVHRVYHVYRVHRVYRAYRLHCVYHVYCVCLASVLTSCCPLVASHRSERTSVDSLMTPVRSCAVVGCRWGLSTPSAGTTMLKTSRYCGSGWCSCCLRVVKNRNLSVSMEMSSSLSRIMVVALGLWA